MTRSADSDATSPARAAVTHREFCVPMRERMPQLQSISTGSGNTMNQCSRMASAISVARKVKPTAVKADASDAHARATSAAVMMVEPVTDNREQKVQPSPVKKLVR